ncbi:DUF2214 family protein [Pigmentiphaga soli]
MFTDTLLAWLHHLCLLGMAACLAAQAASLGGPWGQARLRRLARIDAGYGLLAMGILAVGAARVAFGAKPAAFYLDNPVFWAKIAVFLLVGALSAGPTRAFMRWRRQARQQPDYQPPAAELATVRRLVRWQAAGWVALPGLAAAMARGIGS